jgi:hypothetical protein
MRANLFVGNVKWKRKKTLRKLNMSRKKKLKWRCPDSKLLLPKKMLKKKITN